VKQNGLALRFVRKQTPDVCIAAVAQNSEARHYVIEQFRPHVELAMVLRTLS